MSHFRCKRGLYRSDGKTFPMLINYKHTMILGSYSSIHTYLDLPTLIHVYQLNDRAIITKNMRICHDNCKNRIKILSVVIDIHSGRQTIHTDI